MTTHIKLTMQQSTKVFCQLKRKAIIKLRHNLQKSYFPSWWSNLRYMKLFTTVSHSHLCNPFLMIKYANKIILNKVSFSYLKYRIISNAQTCYLALFCTELCKGENVYSVGQLKQYQHLEETEYWEIFLVHLERFK